MAYIGLRKPYVGSLKTTGDYETPVQFAKAVSLEVTPNYAEGSLYADDILAEYNKIFKDGDITLGTDTIPATMQKTMFGHAVGTNSEEVTHSADDVSPYVGFGVVVVEEVKGETKFNALFLPKVKFTEPSSSFSTRGDNITYSTPSITGKIAADGNGIWKKTATLKSEQEAIDWITGQFTKS